jgi:beta-fructofuranosidase
VVLTLCFYPTGTDPWRLQVRTAQGARLGFTVDVWELLPMEIKEPDSNAAHWRGRSV